MIRKAFFSLLLLGLSLAYFGCIGGEATKTTLNISGPQTDQVGVNTPFTINVTLVDENGDPSTVLSGEQVQLVLRNPEASSTGTPATLGGDTEATLDGSSASLTVTIDQPGSGYVLTANVNADVVNDSPAFNVLAAETLAGIAFLTSPADVQVNQSFDLQVAAVDANGTVVSQTTGDITLELAQNPGNTTFAPVVAPLVNGTATFSNLQIADPGVGYSFKASGVGFETTSGVFTVSTTPPPPPAASTIGFLALANTTADQVSLFRFDEASNTVTVAGTLPVADGPLGLEAWQSDQATPRLLVLSHLDNTVHSLTVDRTSGQLTEVDSVASPGTTPVDLDIFNDSAFVVNFGSDNLTVLPLNAATGQISTGGPQVNVGTGPIALDYVDVPSNPVDLIVVANQISNDLSVVQFDTNTGIFTTVLQGGLATAPNLAGGLGASGVTVLPITGGEYEVYVTNGGSDNLSTFRMDAAGVLTGQTLVATGNDPVLAQLAGSRLYVLNEASNDISGFTVDPANGALTALTTGFPVASGGTQPADAVFVTTSAGASFLVVSNFAPPSFVQGFQQQTDGSLTGLAAGPFPTVDGASGLDYIPPQP